MTIRRILSFVLCIALLLPCLTFPGFAAATPTVYLDSVNGSDSNNGLTEAQAVATLNGAYSVLKSIIGTADKGTIVLVNDYTFVFSSEKGVMRDIASAGTHSYEVVFTGKTPQTALEFYLYDQCYIGMQGPTTFENITLRITEDSASTFLSIHGRGPLTIGEGVSTSTNPDRRPSLSAGAYFNSSAKMQLTVNSGDWRNLYAGGYIKTMSQTANLVMNGGTAVKIGTNFSGTQNGDSNITINGGTVGIIMGSSINAAGKQTGNVYVNLNGGTLTGELDADGIGTLSGTATVNVAANDLTIKTPGTVTVNKFSCGNLTLGSATKLAVTDAVTGTTAVTVDPSVRYNFDYITAPSTTADGAFTFSQANMTVQTGNNKVWKNLDNATGFTGLVLKAPSAQTIKLYPGTSGGSVITPDSTETVDGYKYQYYANIMGTYRSITTQTGYYSTTKIIYMSESESLTKTVADVTAAKKAGTGFEPSSVKDYSDEMHQNIPSGEAAPWWEDYSAYLNTPAFTEGRAAHQATTQAEMESYIASLDDSNDNMYVYSMGTSETYGYNMPIVIFTATDLSGAKTLEEAAALVRANSKVTVHYQAQIHGNEPAAGEAALAQIGRLDTAYGDNLLQNINIYVIPRLNPDGSYKYQRNNITGINMNRDMLLAQTQEIKNHHYVYGLFEPELAIDSHEYTYQPELATGTYNDMMIASGHNGNSGKAFVEYSEMFARLPFESLYSYQMQPSYYTNVSNGKYAASGTNYRGMRGSVSILLESRGIGGGNHTYERRVTAHLIAMEQILGYAAANSAELQAVSDAERQRIASSGMTYEESDTIVLEHEQTPDASLKHTNKTYNNASGVVTNTYTTTPKAYRAALAGRDRARPTAYVIPAGEDWTQDVLDLMDVQKVSYYFVDASQSIKLQQYTGTIESASLTGEQYYSFENGCYVLPMNQQNATILAILMEPDIADEYNVDAGGTSTTVPSGTLAQMEIIPCENEVFPIYRYVQDLNADGTVDTTILPAAPSGLTATKITMAGGTGSITGLDAAKTYEYRGEADSTYTAVAPGTTELTGLAAGTYYVRFPATATTAASADAVLEIQYSILSGYTVYVDSTSGADTNDGYSQDAPVKTLEKAYTQLGSLMSDAPDGVAGTVMLLADYALGASAYTFPKHDYPVIFTAKEKTIALTKGGTATQSTCTINLAGDTTFENMTFKIVSASSYNNFNCCGYNVVMGEGLTCISNSKGANFMLGAGGTGGTATTNLTVKSGTWNYIYAGGYTGGVTGEANVSVLGGTVINAVMANYSGAFGDNINIYISNATVPNIFGGYANNGATSIAGNVNITLGEGAKVTTIYAGSRDKGNIKGIVTLIIDGADITSTAIYGKSQKAGTIGGFELLLKDGSLGVTPTNVQKVTVDTTAGGKVSYPASLGVHVVKGNGVAKVGTTAYAPMQYAADNATNSYAQLMIDCSADVKLANDLYLDLAGYDLAGSIDLNGFKLYGLDSTTDSYSDANAGQLTATVAGGKPEVHFRDDGTLLGSAKRYVAVPNENGYSFHRLYLGITHQTVKPTADGVGYKAVFAADNTLKAYLDDYGYSLQLGDYDAITATMEGSKLVSLDTVTLRIQNFDVANFGETELKATVFVTLADGTVIETAQQSTTLRALVEAINEKVSYFTSEQLSALKAMIEKHEVMQSWNVSNI